MGRPGFNTSCLVRAILTGMRGAVIGCGAPALLLTPSLFLSRIEIPFKFHMLHSGLVHGLAFWFDVAFIGSM